MMGSVPGSGAMADLSKLIEDLRHFAFSDDSIEERFNDAFKDFEDSNNEIREIRANKERVVEKLSEQFSDHEKASEVLKENAKLIEELREFLLSSNEPVPNSEERESFLGEKSLLEEAIGKYRNRISLLQAQGSTQLEEMKNKHDIERSRLHERKKCLEAQIQACLEDFERQKTELKIKHERILENFSEKFKSRLSEIEKLKSHRQCESELATWRSSWNETLQGLEQAIERTGDVVSGVGAKKRRTTRRRRVSIGKNSNRFSTDSREDYVPPMRECSIVIEPLEIPDSSDECDPNKSLGGASLCGEIETEPSPLSSPLTPTEHSASRKRLFSEQPIDGSLGTITDAAPHTIEGYLRSLQRIVSENTKEQKNRKRKTAP